MGIVRSASKTCVFSARSAGRRRRVELRPPSARRRSRPKQETAIQERHEVAHRLQFGIAVAAGGLPRAALDAKSQRCLSG
jgi:hypothetical protein